MGWGWGWGGGGGGGGVEEDEEEEEVVVVVVVVVVGDGGGRTGGGELDILIINRFPETTPELIFASRATGMSLQGQSGGTRDASAWSSWKHNQHCMTLEASLPQRRDAVV